MGSQQMNAAELLRNLLVSPPIEERDIEEGMNVLYAYAVPIGEIIVEMVKVGEVIDGRLPAGLKGFRGILPSGNNGSNLYRLDINLNVKYSGEDTVLTCIFDKYWVMEAKEQTIRRKCPISKWSFDFWMESTFI